MTTLHGRSSKININLSEALANCKTELTDAVAIIYSPSFCKFAKFENGKLIDEKLQEIDIRTVFEAKVFNPHAELRWLNVSNGQGRAVLISEENISQYLDDDIQDLTTVDDGIIEQTYLLWGKGVVRSPSTPQQGWSRLSAARTGALDVPITGIHTKQQVQLIAKEYIGFCEGEAGEKYGNVAVLEERLIELKPLEAKP